MKIINRYHSATAAGIEDWFAFGPSLNLPNGQWDLTREWTPQKGCHGKYLLVNFPLHEWLEIDQQTWEKLDQKRIVGFIAMEFGPGGNLEGYVSYK
jgi:hypothetical protein